MTNFLKSLNAHNQMKKVFGKFILTTIIVIGAVIFLASL
jgi:hypothetical protein